jgi:hypothetical protein
MASSNDIKAARRLRDNLLNFIGEVKGVDPDEFQRKYDRLLIDLQHDISAMAPAPIISLSASSVERRLAKESRGVS